MAAVGVGVVLGDEGRRFKQARFDPGGQLGGQECGLGHVLERHRFVGARDREDAVGELDISAVRFEQMCRDLARLCDYFL